jgi:hypothetical protein
VRQHDIRGTICSIVVEDAWIEQERERECVWGALFSIVRDGRDGT